MARKVRTTFLYLVFSIFFCAYLSHHYLRRDVIVFVPTLSIIADPSYPRLRPFSQPPTTTTEATPNPTTLTTTTRATTNPKPIPLTNTITTSSSVAYINPAIHENLTHQNIPSQTQVAVPAVTPPPPPLSPYPDTLSILLPDWEVLVIVSREDTARLTSSSLTHDDEYHCLFPNNDFSPAKPSGILPFPDRATFKCILPNRIRRRLPFPKPVLTKNLTNLPLEPPISPAPEMFRFTYIVYDSLTTDDDVVVFVKGLNNHQGSNRDPSEFSCVFYTGDDVANGIRTTVTNSMQEVFRCERPPEAKALESLTDGGEEAAPQIKVTVETVQDKQVVPTVAYYDPRVRKLANDNGKDGKALLCACTMVYNVAKFLKEWVMYHSKLGVEKFILYDNGSNDDLHKVVEELVGQGFDVNTYFWFWPKTQEAGFSHSAVYSRESCAWTAYIDVDEFIYSPSWSSSAVPSNSMLHSLLSSSPPRDVDDPDHGGRDGLAIAGQVHIECHEFGPSNQTEHPPMGVMQGYNCRKHKENRHKSIVLLAAIDDSLLNVIHHFSLKPGYVGRKLSIRKMIVNHYKFQAWPEFKAKFKRRVSAYVADWTRQVNRNSNDRTPGLGYEAVEPEGWPQMFCEVEDDGLKVLAQQWFATESDSGYKIAWQR